jgi:2-furoyl-CoA dehydrogenase FAD binding subunit
MLNMRLARPRLLIDIMHIPDWQRVTDDGQALRIGAGVRQITIERRPDLPQRQPLLAAIIPHLGHTQTRTAGTICGSVAHADPSAELPLVLVALCGTIHLRSCRRQMMERQPRYWM